MQRCRRKHKLLPSSTYCRGLNNRVWINVFRVEEDLEIKSDDAEDYKPIGCVAATLNHSVLYKTHISCDETVKYFVCKQKSSLSVDVTTTLQPRDMSTTITTIVHQHVTNKSNTNTIGLIGGVTVAGVVLIAVIVVIVCKMRKIGPFRKQLLYEDTIDMNSVGYAIPENYDTVLNTDNRSIQNVYINSDTGENTYDMID